MKSGKFDWRILRRLSKFAFVIAVVVWVFEFFHRLALQQSVIENPATMSVWLERERSYIQIGSVFLALTIGLRIAYWIIEYVTERRRSA